MSLVKVLILSNVFDPTVTLGELLDAFRAADAIECDERQFLESECPDERDAFLRRLAVLL